MPGAASAEGPWTSTAALSDVGRACPGVSRATTTNLHFIVFYTT